MDFGLLPPEVNSSRSIPVRGPESMILTPAVADWGCLARPGRGMALAAESEAPLDGLTPAVADWGCLARPGRGMALAAESEAPLDGLTPCAGPTSPA